MKLFRHAADLIEWRRENRLLSVGFVPTMGALHNGHISLIEKAKSENPLVVCSIFVNPTQFNNADDLKRYPRTPEQDLAMLAAAGCDVVFMPDEAEIYPAAPQMQLNFGNLEEVMEGSHRPGHFNGVGLVVSKLFHMVQPDRAYFGQKDLQQFLIIKRLVADLSFPVQLVCCPVVREADGLAMSSRNVRLSAEARLQAPALYRALTEAQQRITQGENPQMVCSEITRRLNETGIFSVEYLTLADTETLASVQSPQAGMEYALCIAAFLDGVRLIDNVVFRM
ncbi:pantoate--beta-alanine ligase [Rhodoflexus caldus]|uniref:pantoate--beta-alanine ligase n=1 Tax=Rhodoflexus caldus TaxID=2891236 RepID=UPI00202A79BA|nr:pantoate--beta-alanine ligase [Rhodoflexus caldus]